MRGLFFKVFIILWIAESLIFVISTALIVRHHFDTPVVVFDALFSSLHNEAREASAVYEAGGCNALRTYAAAHDHQISLSDLTGQDACASAGAQTPMAGAPIATAGSLTSTIGPIPTDITGKQVGQQYVWSVPVTSATGKRYIFLLSRPHVAEKESWGQDLLRFAFPPLPVAIVVGGIATVVLVLLVTRPLTQTRFGGVLPARTSHTP